MSRVVVATDSVIQHIFFGADDETVAPADAEVSVTVVDGLGRAMPGGTAVEADGVYQFTITTAAHTATVNRLLVTWSAMVEGRQVADTERVDVVGSRYFRLHHLRAGQGLGNTTVFPNSELARARNYVEEFIDDFTEYSWAPAWNSELVAREARGGLRLRRAGVRKIIAASNNLTPIDIAAWSVTGDGTITTGAATVPTAGVTVEYEYGDPECPADLHLAALKLARHVMLSSDSSIPDRARMFQTPTGLFHLDTASENRPTGLPEVDSVLIRRRYGSPHFIA